MILAGEGLGIGMVCSDSNIWPLEITWQQRWRILLWWRFFSFISILSFIVEHFLIEYRKNKKQSNLNSQSVRSKILLSFNSQDLCSNSPYCLPYSSFDVSLENLVLDQLIRPQSRQGIGKTPFLPLNEVLLYFLRVKRENDGTIW